MYVLDFLAQLSVKILTVNCHLQWFLFSHCRQCFNMLKLTISIIIKLTTVFLQADCGSREASCVRQIPDPSDQPIGETFPDN